MYRIRDGNHGDSKIDENEEIHIKEDENSGVKWVPVNEILEVTSETWVRDRIYAKIIDKMKKDGILEKMEVVKW